MSDRSDYTNTGNRALDDRKGFGDDMGTRVGRPDGAQPAPRDASPGDHTGHVSTNDAPVAAGIEGSIEEGPAQERVQRASRGGDVNPPPPAGNERRIDDL